MAAESGNYIDDLIPTAPAGSESRSFGDDHIRLIKRILVNTFAGFPGAVIVTGTESSGASANDFVVFIDPQPATYTNRMLVSFLATHNNSGAASIRINSLSPVSFVANDGAALAADMIKNGSEVLAVFDGTQFRLIAANNVQPLPPDELPNQAGHEGQFLTTNGAAAAWQPLTILRSPQAGGYTILQSDLSKLIYWTGSSLSFIGIVAASALGAGWYCYIYNAGTAAITIDPTGAETINGQANITLQPSQGAIIQCNGSNFVTLDFNKLPSPTGQNGKWLTTDGNTAQWDDLPASSLPPMAGNSGLFLSTDGVQGVWVSIPFPPNELPSQAGQGGMFLQTNGTAPSWEPIPTELPSQTGNDGRILSTDGTDPLWIDAPTGGGGGVEELPPQAGQAGRFLQTNGTDPAWANVPAELPSQTGQGGAFLSTNGTNPLWATPSFPPPELPPQAGHASQFLTTNGTDPSWAAVPPTPPELPAMAGMGGRFLTNDGSIPSWGTVSSSSSLLYNLISGNYTADESDKGKIIRFTGTTATLSIVDVATLSAGWFCYVQNAGTGILTIDPFGTQTVSGKTTWLNVVGDVILLTTDGTQFFRTVLYHANYQEFLVSGTWTKPDNASYVYVEAVAGGGGGAASSTAAAAGGGGGEFVNRILQASQLGATETITVGAGGAGKVTGSVGPGVAGGNTLFGSLITALGGSRGATGSTTIPPPPRVTATSLIGASNFQSHMPFIYGSYGGGNGYAGGNCLYGGAGGGQGDPSVPTAGGVSIYAGNGGNGVISGAGGAGAVPGGGGGGVASIGAGSFGGNGGAGRIRIWTW